MDFKASAFLFIGPPGGGKGTVAKRIKEAKEHNMYYIETGEETRQRRKRDLAFEAQWGALMQAGDYLPDQVMKTIVLELVAKMPLGYDLILDGYPRTLEQAQFIVPYLREVLNYQVITMFLEVSIDEALNRLINRMLQSGGTRDDDRIDVFKTRIGKYSDSMENLQPYLRSYTRPIEVVAEDHPDEVYTRSLKHVVEFCVHG